MKKEKLHIGFSSLGLLLLLVFAFTAKEVHQLTDFRHAPLKTCSTTQTDATKTHLHDADYASHPCTICDFTFSFFEFALTSFRIFPIEVAFIETDFFYISFKLSAAYLFQSLRAPPAFI